MTEWTCTVNISSDALVIAMWLVFQSTRGLDEISFGGERLDFMGLWSTPKSTVSEPRLLHYEGRSIFSLLLLHYEGGASFPPDLKMYILHLVHEESDMLGLMTIVGLKTAHPAC